MVGRRGIPGIGSEKKEVAWPVTLGGWNALETEIWFVGTADWGLVVNVTINQVESTRRVKVTDCDK